MSKRVYGLKHATGKMKIQHMHMMMDFKADLKEKQENPPDRHVALAQIKDLMGSADFNTWYDKVYELRRCDQNAAYEQAIFSKLEELTTPVAAPVVTPEATPTNTKQIKWHVASDNTLRAYAVAIKDFETVTNTKVDRADMQTIQQWHESLKARKPRLAPNTIRARLSAVRLMSGIKYPLPKKQKAGVDLLSLKQVRAVLAQAKNAGEREALMKSLSGFDVISKRANVNSQTDFDVHFLGVANTPTSAQAVTRLLKRCAKKAGIDQAISLRIWAQSGAWLLKVLSPVEFSKLMPLAETPITNTKPLHGIGRRSHLVKA